MNVGDNYLSELYLKVANTRHFFYVLHKNNLFKFYKYFYLQIVANN